MPPCCTPSCTRSFLLKYHLPLGLAFGILLGYLVPSAGTAWSSVIPRNEWIKMSNVNVFLIFFFSGLKLQTKAVVQALKTWKAVLFGVVVIMLLTPLVSFGLVNLPFQTRELSFGLAIFFLGPTTISSGVILTGQAKGNIALGLMLTVVTNLLAIVSMPLVLSLVFADVEGVTVSIDAGALLLKLVLYILLPLLLGKGVNYCLQCTNGCTKRFKIRLKLFSSFLLIQVPWMSVSKEADKFNSMTGGEVVAVFGVGISLHFVFLCATYFTARKLFPLAERKAVVILGSQKTLPVALSVISFLPLALGSHGLMSLPCIISHFCQIVMDGVVAARWAEYVDDDAGGEEQQEQKDGGLLKDPNKKGEEQQRWQQQTPDVEVAAQKDESIELVV
jgi:solute carrier family 10 (sodium/bile acid cotransporter), member 7